MAHERVQHPDLDGAKATPTSKDKGCFRLRSIAQHSCLASGLLFFQIRGTAVEDAFLNEFLLEGKGPAASVKYRVGWKTRIRAPVLVADARRVTLVTNQTTDSG